MIVVAVTSPDVVAVLRDYLDALSQSAHQQLGKVAGVAVTMATDTEGLITLGASTELARAVDRWQFSIGQGPCLTALSGGGGGYVADLAQASDWGEYGAGAAARGARSCLSIPVLLDGTVQAVFKIYSADVDGLDEQQRRTGARVAVEIAGGIGLARSLRSTAAELADRAAAMDSRRTIDLALGMLMERTSCGSDEAFDLLRRYSQQHNVKVRDVAVELTSGRMASAGHHPRPEPAPGLAVAPFRPRGAQPAATVEPTRQIETVGGA